MRQKLTRGWRKLQKEKCVVCAPRHYGVLESRRLERVVSEVHVAKRDTATENVPGNMREGYQMADRSVFGAVVVRMILQKQCYCTSSGFIWLSLEIIERVS